MKKLPALCLILILLTAVFNPPAGAEEALTEPADVSALESSGKKKKDYTVEYWLFGSVPTLVLVWGLTVWDWGSSPKWQIMGDGYGLEQDSYTGGADKMGHLWGVYTVSRIGSYAFEKSGDSPKLAAYKGFLFGQFVGLGIEVGDGFGDTYGYSWGDMYWNFAGGLLALLLDLYPPLDDLIGCQFEYWPSRDHIDRKQTWIEFTSDVSGQKYIFALKFTGVPYLRDTFLKFFQIDFGYYTRGYWFNPSHYTYKSRHAYIGFSLNLSRICESVFPEGNWRASTSRFFKYYHAPIAYNPDALDYTLPGKEKIIQNR